MSAISDIVKAQASETVRRMNPELFQKNGGVKSDKVPPAGMKLRPTTDEENLNKLEAAFWEWLQKGVKSGVFVWIGCQNMTLKLADDVRYTPDFSAVLADRSFVFYETKGAHFWDDAKVKLKIAAREYRWAGFMLVRKGTALEQFHMEYVRP